MVIAHKMTTQAFVRIARIRIADLFFSHVYFSFGQNFGEDDLILTEQSARFPLDHGHRCGYSLILWYFFVVL